ncbi:MAG: T9SS type A sorting domain-containing protein [Pigmentiphaga sp.]|nr:T9SS type A sorting domain-containing protein [Pigmentiphaga sp.]
MKKLFYLLFLIVLALFANNAVAQPTNGLEFNGIDQYMSIPSHSDFDISSGEALTITFWAKTPLTSRNQRMVNRRFDAAYDPIYGKSGYGVTLLPAGGAHPYADWAFEGSATYVNGTTSPYFPDEWFHIAASFDMGTKQLTMYMDGEHIGTSAPINGDHIGSISDVYVGTWSIDGGTSFISEYFKGEIQSLRFYSKSLTESEVQADMSAVVSSETPDLIAAYDMTNIQKIGDDDVVPDIMGNHPGVLHNFDTIDFDTNQLIGLDFNGTDQYLTISNHSDFDIESGNSLSFSCWVKTPVKDKVQRLIMRRYADDSLYGNTGYGIALLSNARPYTDWYYKTNVLGNGAGKHVLASDWTYESDDWFHLTGVFDVSTKQLSLYYNGLLLGSNVNTLLEDIHSQSDIYIGTWVDKMANMTLLNQFFSGEIANLRIWGKAMSKEDVMADMVSEVTAETPSLIAAYDLTKIQKEEDDIYFIPDITGNHPAELHGFVDIDTNSATSINRGASALNCYVNADGKLVVKLQNGVLSTDSTVRIYNSLGQLIVTESLTGQDTEVSTPLKSGLYIVKCLNQTAKVLVK